MMLTSASTVVGCRCFTVKAICSLSSCVRYYCKDSSSGRVSALHVGNAQYAKTINALPKSAHPLDFFFVRQCRILPQKNMLTREFKMPVQSLDGLLVFGLISSGNCLNPL